MAGWPEWWEWELDASLPHLRKRMLGRNFNETDLRAILEDAAGYREDHEPGRYVVEAIHGGERWHIIVEPQPDEQTLVVITAYKPD